MTDKSSKEKVIADEDIQTHVYYCLPVILYCLKHVCIRMN